MEKLNINTETNTELQTAVELHQRILTNGALAAQALVDFSKNLKQMRDQSLYIQLGYETFENYVEQAVGIKQRQAYNYISSLEKLGDKIFSTVSHLGITKIEMLTSVPLVEREGFMEENNLEKMSTRELKDAIEKINGYEEQISLLTEQNKTTLDKKDDEIAALKKQSEDIKKKDNEIKILQGKVKELETRPIEVAVEEPSIKTIEKIRADAEKEVLQKMKPQLKELEIAKKQKLDAEQRAKELEKKLQIAGTKETATFSVYFEQAKTAINQMIETIDTLAETDEEIAQRLKGALLRFTQQIVEVLEGQ